tara:strand:- start:1389 stop:2330 length:942 start_codon:yes stop_codon:yes gene_type:complete
MFDAIVDANVNRVSEGLRVIEEYVRFVCSKEELTTKLATLRKDLNRLFPQTTDQLHARMTGCDVRAREIPKKRINIKDVLTANFKRVEEGLRVLEEYTGEAFCNHFRYDMYDLEAEVLLLISKFVIRRGVYLISDDVDILKDGIRVGCSMVQLRSKCESKDAVFNKAKIVSDFSREFDVPFIVNDYLDIAMLVNADGVHTGQDDISVDALRRVWRADKIFGRTTHSFDQGVEAKDQGSDYISVGPVFETPSKPGRSGIGFDYLSNVKSLDIPYVAIGGIDEACIESVMDHSPFMVGVIRAYKNVSDWQTRYFS